MNIQPKPYIEHLKLRHHSIGKERRLNWLKLKLENQTPFPLGVDYEDIDYAVNEWVTNKLDLEFEGKKIPTFKLYSNQRINEYAQTWQHLDETGNILMNFKTVTRENNPKKGTNQGESYNIPGNRDYPMFMIPVLQENGQEAYDMYSMKQPFSVDFDYTINLITNKYELLNKMNSLINYEFKALQSYIAPNGHAMPMTLEEISDESEYNINDRKYYSQTYKIKVKGYIVKKEDFKVTHLPSRFTTRIIGLKDTLKNKHNGKIQIIEDYCEIKEDDFYPKKITLDLSFDVCEDKLTFVIDVDFTLEDIVITNIHDFVIRVNDEYFDIENPIDILNGDSISIEISRENPKHNSELQLKGYDPNVIIDNRINHESELDEEVGEEIIDINTRFDI